MRSDWRHEVFSRFADGEFDPDEALRALLAHDPEAGHAFMDSAIRDRMIAEHRAYVRRQTVKLEKETIANPGAVRLFDLAPFDRQVILRERLVVVTEGERHEYRTLQLAGAHGAAVLLSVIERDKKMAKTTMARCSLYQRLAKTLIAESERAGRDVSVADLLREKAA